MISDHRRDEDSVRAVRETSLVHAIWDEDSPRLVVFFLMILLFIIWDEDHIHDIC